MNDSFIFAEELPLVSRFALSFFPEVYSEALMQLNSTEEKFPYFLGQLVFSFGGDENVLLGK